MPVGRRPAGILTYRPINQRIVCAKARDMTNCRYADVCTSPPPQSLDCPGSHPHSSVSFARQPVGKTTLHRALGDRAGLNGDYPPPRGDMCPLSQRHTLILSHPHPIEIKSSAAQIRYNDFMKACGHARVACEMTGRSADYAMNSECSTTEATSHVDVACRTIV